MTETTSLDEFIDELGLRAEVDALPEEEEEDPGPWVRQLNRKMRRDFKRSYQIEQPQRSRNTRKRR